MTKYIVNSGNIKAYPEKMRAYNDAIYSDFIGSKKPVKVLMCFFAMPREDWETKYIIYKKNLLGDFIVRTDVEMAMPEKFKEQCKNAEVIYVSGGDDELLACRFSQFDLPDMWEGKVIATSSAGSDYLAHSFWTCDWRMCMDGLGILPIKVIPHFNSCYGADDPRGPIDWQKAHDELALYGDTSLPIHALEEGDFIVQEI